MGTIAHFAIDAATREVAASAAQWLRGFMPQVQVALDDAGIRLESDHHNQAALAAIWAAALANEVSHQRSQTQRAAAWRTLAA